MDNVLLNGGLLGDAPKKKGGIQPDRGMFIFNGYNLHNGTTRLVINSDHDDLGEIAFETYNAPRTDGGFALNKFYRTKTITLAMCLKSNTKEGLNDLIDELKFQTSKMQGYLDIIINGLVRRREATLTSLKFGRRNYNLTFIQNVILTFKCINPLSFSLESITNTYNGINGNYITEINYTGKVNCYPSIYVLIHNATNLNSFSIDMNGYLFKIQEEIEAGDLVIIDGETKLVKLNGSVILYDGPFPVIEPGLNHVEIKTNSGSLVNYDITFIYKKLFL